MLDESPDTPIVLNRLGTWYALQQDLVNGEKYFKRLLEIAPDYVDGYLNPVSSTRMHPASKRPPSWPSRSSRSFRAPPRRGLLGIVRLKQKDYRGALESLDAAIEYYRGNHEALANRSVAYYFLGRKEDALADLKRAREIAPENERYARFVGQLERELRAR